jgi:hypothetical protein
MRSPVCPGNESSTPECARAFDRGSSPSSASARARATSGPGQPGQPRLRPDGLPEAGAVRRPECAPGRRPLGTQADVPPVMDEIDALMLHRQHVGSAAGRTSLRGPRHRLQRGPGGDGRLSGVDARPRPIALLVGVIGIMNISVGRCACPRTASSTSTVGQDAEARELDAVQERVHRGSTALNPAGEAVATRAPVVGRRIDCLRRATFDHLRLDAAAF